MKPRLAVRFAVAVLPVLTTLLSTPSARAQSEHKIGSFRVSTTKQTRGYATLAPTGGAREGTLTWYCFGDREAPYAVIDLGALPRDTLVIYAIWRFDQDKPDTTFFVRRRTMSVRDTDAARFMTRMKSASELVIRVLGNPPSEPGTEYTYHLAGADSALNQLGCARNLPAQSASASWRAPEALPLGAPAADDSTYEASEVQQQPELLAVNEFRRDIIRSYPPALRDANVPGSVTLRFRVLADGRVDMGSVHVLRATHDAFAQAAVRSLPLLQFRPARRNGRPVNAWVAMPFDFSVGGR